LLIVVIVVIVIVVVVAGCEFQVPGDALSEVEVFRVASSMLRDAGCSFTFLFDIGYWLLVIFFVTGCHS